MKVIFLFILILTSIEGFGFQTSKPDVQIMNGSDLFNDSSRTKHVEQKAKEDKSKTYTSYKVGEGDTWNSIAQKFGITYSELRLANASSDKLIAGSKINIPTDRIKVNDPYYEKKHLDAPKAVTLQDGKTKHHMVMNGQTLFSISKMYDVSVDEIKEWNGLKSNSISVGQKLIVGKNAAVATETKSEIKKEAAPKTEEAKVLVVEKPVTKTEPVTAPAKPTVTDKPVKNENVSEEKKVVAPASPTVTEKNKEDEKIIFANGRHEVNESGKALCIEEDDAITDKYYAFHRTAPIGTIIRVSNKSNSRKVYVKVIGELPNTFDNEGAIIKISKSSAEKLGVTDKNFEATLLYGVN